MKIALAQMEISENVDKNLEKALELIEEAANNGAQIICFSELQLNPFFPQYKGGDASNYEISISDEKIKKNPENLK